MLHFKKRWDTEVFKVRVIHVEGLRSCSVKYLQSVCITRHLEMFRDEYVCVPLERHGDT